MAQGKIKWFDPKKGYGFITPDDGSKDAFLHVSALEKADIRTLEEGEVVTYNLAEQRGKQSAVDIIKSEGKASTSFLQRKLQIGYNRAARIIDMMEEDGIVSKANHVGKRDVL